MKRLSRVGRTMTAIRGKKALYEVISKNKPKPVTFKRLEERRDRRANGPAGSAGKPTEGLKKPSMFWFADGRLEMSVPYQLAIAVILGVILLVMVVFRLGQASMGRTGDGKAVNTVARDPRVVSIAEKSAVSGEPDTVASEDAGGNRIVIQTFKVRAQLEPVRDYFASAGLATEIKSQGDWYYLVTRDKYENPDNPTTEGYRVKQKVIQLGTEYKAPPGYETFGPKPFHDCYGMRFDD